MRQTLRTIAAIIVFPTFISANECQDYPNYCRAAAMIAGQPDFNAELGMQVMLGISRMEDSMSIAQMNYLIEQTQQKSDSVNGRVLEARTRVDAILREANAPNRLGKIAGYLRTIATLASVANEIIKFADTSTLTSNDGDGDGENVQAVDGSETYFGKLNEEFALSGEARARVETLLSEDYGGRYFAVKAILRRLDELGPPTSDSLSDAPVEQEILLSKAFAILSGWSATEADERFENFSFELNSINDLLDDASKVSPLAIFTEILFQSQPVGDGTVFSINNIPGLFEELEPHAMGVLKWRDPELFGGDTVQPPWNLE